MTALSFIFSLWLAGAASGAPAGAVADMINDGFGTPPGAAKRQLVLTAPVVFDELIETGPESALEIIFSDGTRLQLGAEASLVIDSFVYDPATQDGEMVLRLAEGAFRFASGAIRKDDVRLITPSLSLGIRGTELVIAVDPDGATDMNALRGTAVCAPLAGGPVLTLSAGMSARTGGNGRWERGETRAVNPSGDPAIDEGFESARRRWAR